MVDLIRQSGATYLFVALGSPRGQTWIDEHLDQLDVPVCAEIGGVLNFLAGSVKRAPRWMQQGGLEWLYRVAQEPRRLWRRYLVDDLPIFVRMLRRPSATLVDTMEPMPAPPVLLERDVPAALFKSAAGGS